MKIETIVNASLIPASETLSQIVEAVHVTINAVKDVHVEKNSFTEFSGYLERMIPFLKELGKKSTNNSESFNNFLEILNREIKVAKQLVLECSKRNKLYLFVSCRRIVKRLEDITKEISRALSLIPLASLDLSFGITKEINKLCDNMQGVEFTAAALEEEILEKIESGVQDRNFDRTYANELLVSIAEAVGMSTERSALKKEFEAFKCEIEDAQQRKDQTEVIQMDQIIALLGRADATSSPGDKEMEYLKKRNSLGSQLLEPLQSFYCPITRDVMEDPVETSSGQTFERSAIKKWFADGKTNCPLTMTLLNTAILRPNKSLRQSIQEWKERNTMITIISTKPKLLSDEVQEVLHYLSQLQDLCEERDLHREWVTLENYIPVLIKLLGSKNHEIRNRALFILYILAKDSDDTKERIAKVDTAINSIVHSLARRIGESKLAVTLLLELSKSDVVRDSIGKTQGCILLLVTMSSSDDTQAANDSKQLLESLSVLDQNVVQMAKANYFRPLLQRLSSGPENVKMIMATTLADELSDHSKLNLCKDGALEPLLHMVSHGNGEMKKVAVNALHNLSSLPQNGLQMIREGAICPLFELLYCHSLSSPSLREQAAATIMNIAISASAQEASQVHASLLKSDEEIMKLFSFINLTGPNVQRSILRTFHAMCQGSSATYIRTTLRQISAVQVLVQLCELNNLTVRADALKLFCSLTEGDDDANLSDHVGQKCIDTLLKITNTSEDEEELTAIMGIISNLPMDSLQITQWLVDAGAIPIIFRFLNGVNGNGPSQKQLIENAAGAMRRFTVSTNQEWQKKAATAGTIPVLVQLLGSGTALTKQYAAISLSQFSESSISLTRLVERHRGFWCFSPAPEIGCPVHRGMCTVESSFCLVEADALQPLVRVLGEPHLGACEAALQALLSLIDGERLQNGSKVLAEENAITPIIRLLSSSSAKLQEEAMLALERIFRLVEFKQRYGDSAQMPLVDITQRGSNRMKGLAARILAHLNVLHDQSSYF